MLQISGKISKVFILENKALMGSPRIKVLTGRKASPVKVTKSVSKSVSRYLLTELLTELLSE